MFKPVSIFLSLFIFQAAAQASALERLNQFTGDLITFQAGFIQTLYDADSQPIQESRGAVILKRPGKFRWDYREPYVQSIIADGEKLWIYDTDLEQVTVKTLDRALGNAPIMLLSENRPLDLDFELRDLGEREGLQWVELQPKVRDTDFEKIYMGLSETALEVMELRDQFGQATQIRFNNFEMNMNADEQLFAFTPPSGVDIIDATEN
ncbi:MAG: outer membrane lipoprotein chaperone LolA [Pseudomonadota bacterium]